MEKKIDYAKYVVYILALVVLVSALSYAVYNTVFTGTKEIEINTNTLTFHYDELSNGLVLDDPEAFNDVDGITKGGSFPFRVMASSNATQTLNYAIYLTEEEGNTLDKSLVKLALLTSDNNTLVGATSFKNLSGFDKKAYATLLYQDSLSLVPDVESKKEYVLKYWLGEGSGDIVTSQEDKKQTATLHGGVFKFKVNVMLV